MSKQNRELWYLTIFYLITAAAFTELTTSLVMGLAALVLHLLLYRRSKKVLLLVVSVVLSFLALDYFGGLVIRQQLASRFDLGMDHRIKPESGKDINSDGVRCYRESSEFADDGFNIIFLGDSFTYGLELERLEDTFVAQTERILAEKIPGVDVRTVNFGWVSSSPVLSYRLLQDIGAKYRPDLVIYCLDMTDFHDDLRYTSGKRFIGASPIAYLVNWMGFIEELAEVRRRLRGATWVALIFGRNEVIPTDRFFVTSQRLGDSLPYMTTTEEYLLKIRDDARDKRGAKFAVFCLPRSYQYSDRECPDNWEAYAYQPLGPYVEEPFAWFAAFASKTRIPCYSLLTDFKETDVFPTCFEHDPHWNADGHRVAAEAMVRFLLQQGLVPHADADDAPDGS